MHGESHSTSTHYTNINGVQEKKTVTSHEKFDDKGVIEKDSTMEHTYPDGHKEVIKIKDDGKGHVVKDHYKLEKGGEHLPIE